MLNRKGLFLLGGLFLLALAYSNLDISPSSKLMEGQKAPILHTKDINGVSINTDTLFGEKKLLLCFLGSIKCSICRNRLFDLQSQQKTLIRNNIFPIVFFESSSEEIRKILKEVDYSIPLIPSDTARTNHQHFGITKQFNLQYGTPSQLTAEFLVNEEGLLQMVHYGNYHEDFSDILKP